MTLISEFTNLRAPINLKANLQFEEVPFCAIVLIAIVIELLPVMVLIINRQAATLDLDVLRKITRKKLEFISSFFLRKKLLIRVQKLQTNDC